ncbi:non-canonical purine NTP pyrophosphatase [Polaribacter reichenbachii]|uniref:dITP/XTP pyrophosphatase n=1 Tax=Polaribacter reichenbachii TaxID=996801 RepID=A0A1B8TPP6_9FLAO|nr:non-canonical purine NTP diphosphatase [Polaribacter reichenbachii]APZ46862.1 non-canonical purine NTP pyrophosphatase [Polaribacter reichenbachii]AUC17505.1 non-canonical purine NTP pyrophosphatase [Polaribacter reichenbachii]OBY61620.1 non-canonical purine NTP pyrophosphatase [Polaribacter reichenbachii]
MKLVFATNNLNKLAEVQKMMPKSIELLSLKDINCFDEIDETETTLEGNAKLKADYITQKFGYNCFADDTGLEVESLGGKPGVYSARFAGEPANSDNNMQKLLSELKEKENKKAQFRTAVALNLNDEKFLFEGICKGDILTEKQGEKGFGYDPIFKPKGYNLSFAEMSSEEKNKISHRGIAIQKLVAFLNDYKS